MLIVAINPIKQLQKARDSKVEYDLRQINNALDLYYNDNNCYPPSSSLVFGSSFQQESTVFMTKLPQDPDCANGGSCYTYITDASRCPRWNVLFAKIYNVSNLSSTCALQQACPGLDTDFYSGYNYCVLSGEVNCVYLKSISNLPIDAGKGTGGSGSGGSSPTSSPGGGSSPTSSPGGSSSPPPTVDCGPDKYYAVTGGKCNFVGTRDDQNTNCSIWPAPEDLPNHPRCYSYFGNDYTCNSIPCTK